VAFIRRHRVIYAISPHTVVWALQTGPCRHICALAGHVSMTTRGLHALGLPSTRSSQGVRLYFTGGVLRWPCSTVSKLTGCWPRRSLGYRWCPLKISVCPSLSTSLVSFRLTENLCWREGHAYFMSSRPPSMTPKLCIQDFASPDICFTSKPTVTFETNRGWPRLKKGQVSSLVLCRACVVDCNLGPANKLLGCTTN
jgi:hypothetical protein